MIKIEKKGDTINIRAIGGSETLVKELRHATGVILNSLIRDDMTEAEMEDFWTGWVKLCRMEMQEIREKQKSNDNSLRQKLYQRKPFPWEMSN